MNFDFNEDQKMIREQARRFLETECSSTTVREILEDPTRESHRELWQKAVDMGWVGITIPESYGGLGMGYLELCVIAEEMGRALAPLPFGSSVVLATEALLLAGSEQQKQRLLPGLAAGEALGTTAFRDLAGSAVVASGNTLSGVKQPVLDANSATFAIVSAGDSLYLVDMDQAGVKTELLESLDPTRKVSRVTFDGAEAELLGPAGDADMLIDTLYDRAAIPFAFEQLGGASKALETAVDYARERYAFGRAIGSYQGVKHMLADMYASLELARSNCYRGAWALDVGDSQLPLTAAVCQVSAIEAYTHCAKNNPQVHGGMGFTWEFDCHLHYRRSKLLAVSLGSLTSWKNKLIDRLPTAA